RGAPALERDQAPIGVAVHAAPAAGRELRQRAVFILAAVAHRVEHGAAEPAQQQLRYALDLRELGELLRPALRDLDQRAVAEHFERRPVHLARAAIAYEIELAQHRQRLRVELARALDAQ